METNPANLGLDAVLLGRMQREYVLPTNRPPRLDALGGNLAYTAAGMAVWGGRAGLVSRVNQSYPIEWLDTFVHKGFDLSGIKQVEETIADRFFVAYTDVLNPHYNNPITFFAERKIDFPRELLGYDPTASRYCSKTDYENYSFRVLDMPRFYLEISAAHICPIDFLSHKIAVSVLKAGLVQSLSMRACGCYMDPIFWEEIKPLISDLSAFMLTEAQALKLFQGRSVDLWEIARILAGYGPEYIIIHSVDGAVWLYDRLSSQRIIIPAYPAKVADPTGVFNAFDGGFLISYRKEFDPLKAVLCGCISASFCAEGSGPYYLLDCLQGLAEARMEALRSQVTVL